MTTPDPSREAFQIWRNEDRRRRIPEIRDWTDEQITDLCSFSSEREWEIWQAAMAHKGADLWQPIATAPRDGERILLSGPSGRISVGSWLDGSWFWPQGLAEPTFWQTLPAAPNQEGSA